MPRGTAQIDDVSTWLPPSLDTPWRNVFFEYINECITSAQETLYSTFLGDLVRASIQDDCGTWNIPRQDKKYDERLQNVFIIVWLLTIFECYLPCILLFYVSLSKQVPNSEENRIFQLYS